MSETDSAVTRELPNVGQSEPAQGLSDVPALSGLTALAALLSMGINQLALPALGTHVQRILLTRVEHAGRFAENLAVTAGMIALLAGAVSTLRTHPSFGLTKRLISALFLAIVLRAVVIATLFDRTHTTREHIYLAIGAADVLCIVIGMASLNRAGSLLLRLCAGLATALPLCSLLAVALEVSADLGQSPWMRQAYSMLQGCGEICYLGLLLLSFPLLVPRGLRPHDLVARAAGLTVLVGCAYGLRAASQALGSDFAVLLYHAQRVGLLLDKWPVFYALPLCLALSAVTSATVRGERERVQAALGTLLVLASGYAPRAPGRVLTMTLGLALLARAIVALTEASRRRERGQA